MADVFSQEKRSDVMSRIRGRGNKSTELALIRVFRLVGITGWRRHLKIRRRKVKCTAGEVIARPDFVFAASRVAVFVDGCFWHQCPRHCNIPKGNREFWKQKLDENRRRDRRMDRALRKAGWKVVRVWEHSLKSNDPILHRRLLKALKK